MKGLVLIAGLSLAGGCASRDALVLKGGDVVDSLYYCESRMPEEVMVELWMDFGSRRLRFKCALHDALGWDHPFDGMRLDVTLDERTLRRLARHIRRADVERWPGMRKGVISPPVDATARYLRMRMGEKTLERFAVGDSLAGQGEMGAVIQFALAHKDLRPCSGGASGGE